MSKNLKVIESKPKNLQVKQSKPQNSNFALDFGTEQLFTVVIGAGAWMGFGALTYPTAGTVQSPITA